MGVQIVFKRSTFDVSDKDKRNSLTLKIDLKVIIFLSPKNYGTVVQNLFFFNLGLPR